MISWSRITPQGVMVELARVMMNSPRKGWRRLGGGSFSGKDASKADRLGAYMARLIAKTVVDARLTEECHGAISYAIGKAGPVAFLIDTFGTGQLSDWLLTDAA